MLSLDMFSARAAMMAARSRAFIDGSGRPSLAAVVISRASFPNSLDLTLSCRPLRCMMFLNWECPAMILSAAHSPARPKSFSFEHDLFRKPLHTFRDHAQGAPHGPNGEKCA